MVTSRLPLVVFGVLAVIPGQQASSQETYRFSDLEKEVLVRSISVSQVASEQAALQYDLNDRRLSNLPQVTAYYRFFPDDLTFAENEFGSTHFFGARLSQDLIDLMKGRPARIREGRAALAIKNLEIEEEKDRALFDFHSSYISALEHRTMLQYNTILAGITEQQLQIKEQQYDHHEALLPSVLDVEAALDNYEGMIAFAKSRLAAVEQAFARYFELEVSQFVWDEITQTCDLPKRETLLTHAIENNKELQRIKQAGRLEIGRGQAAQYSDLQFAPFLGVRFRGDNFGDLVTDPEFGFRFSMPVTYFHKKSSRSRRQEATLVALQEKARLHEIDLRDQLNQLYDRFELSESQLRSTEKKRNIYKERLRIETSKSEQLQTLGTTKPELLLQLKQAWQEAELQTRLHAYTRMRLYFELLHLSGYTGANKERPESPAISTSSIDTRKALWVWQSGRILTHREQRQELLDFCLEKNIDQVYFSIDKQLAQQLDYDSRIGSFLARLHFEGVQVSALVGDPEWARPEKRERLLERTDKILMYNSASAAGERFDAIHLNIEPHLLSAWHENTEAILGDYIAALQAVKEKLETARSTIELELDVPAFYNNLPEEQLAALVQVADTIVIMAYQRLSPKQLVTSVNKIMSHTRALSKALVMGLSVDDFQTQEQLTGLIQQVRDDKELGDTFSKFAIHDYDDFKRLAEK